MFSWLAKLNVKYYSNKIRSLIYGICNNMYPCLSIGQIKYPRHALFSLMYSLYHCVYLSIGQINGLSGMQQNTEALKRFFPL